MPSVATSVNPMSERRFASDVTCRRSRFFTEMKAVPETGSVSPAAICALRYAFLKSRSMPMTSPVDFISGPRTTSTPGNFTNGKTASFTAM